MTARDDVSLGDDRALQNGDTVRATTTVTMDASDEIVDQKTEVDSLLAGLGKNPDPMEQADALVADWYATVRDPECALSMGELYRLIEAVAKEFTAKAALRATCDRLLVEIADRDATIAAKDAKIERLYRDLELGGRAIERVLGVINGTVVEP